MSSEIGLDKEIVNSLSGVNGFVYLMFIGGERYVTEFWESFVNIGLVKNKENVQQAVARLRKKEDSYLIGRGTKPTGGRPAKLFTANLDPLNITYNVIIPQKARYFSEKEAKELHRLIFTYFPKFVGIEKKHFGYDVRNRPWSDIARLFFGFISMIGIGFALPKLELPKKIKQSLAFNAPFMIVGLDRGYQQNRGLLKEWKKLREEIVEDLTEEERVYFRNRITEKL